MNPAVVVDIGNSRTKWGWCKNGRVDRISSLGDDLAEWDREIQEHKRAEWVIASVNPPRLEQMLRWIKGRGESGFVLSDYRQIPITNSVPQPGSVGIDRLCACLAARELYGPGPLLVVQAGTAVVINYVSARGEFGGGLILPGFQLMARSLASGTAALPEVAFDEPMTGYPGQTTTEAIRNGIYLATAGSVSNARALYQRAFLTEKLKVVLTGGDADLLADLIQPPLDIAPALTLEGIRLAAGSDAVTRHQLLTPPGTGAIASLAVSGPRAWEVVRSLFRSPNGQPLPLNPTLHRVWFGLFGESTGDEVVIAVQHVEPTVTVEIHSHGGRRVVEWLSELLEERGATIQPLPPASAWALLEQAHTVRTAAVLLDQCQGAFENTVRGILASASAPKLARLAAVAPVGRHLIEPWKVVVAGAPNVGKSSLVNAIAGYQRSVTSPVAGTTRDVVTTVAALDGWPVQLADTAGLRNATESLEASGIDLARKFLREADLVVWLLDATDPLPLWPEDHDGDEGRRMLVVNKTDQAPASSFPVDVLKISATGGGGITELIAAVVGRLVPAPPRPGEAVPYTPALADAVQAAHADPPNGLALLAGCLRS